MKIKCTCVDDTNRPDIIPIVKWVTKGNTYHIIHVYDMMRKEGDTDVPTGIIGFALSEINLLDIPSCPYNCFKSTRFTISESDVPAMMELMKGCAELNNLDILHLIEEQILVEQ